MGSDVPERLRVTEANEAKRFRPDALFLNLDVVQTTRSQAGRRVDRRPGEPADHLQRVSASGARNQKTHTAKRASVVASVLRPSVSLDVVQDERTGQRPRPARR